MQRNGFHLANLSNQNLFYLISHIFEIFADGGFRLPAFALRSISRILVKGKICRPVVAHQLGRTMLVCKNRRLIINMQIDKFWAFRDAPLSLSYLNSAARFCIEQPRPEYRARISVEICRSALLKIFVFLEQHFQKIESVGVNNFAGSVSCRQLLDARAKSRRQTNSLLHDTLSITIRPPDTTTIISWHALRIEKKLFADADNSDPPPPTHTHTVENSWRRRWAHRVQCRCQKWSITTANNKQAMK